jgi:hypothetical protein
MARDDAACAPRLQLPARPPPRIEPFNRVGFFTAAAITCGLDQGQNESRQRV